MTRRCQRLEVKDFASFVRLESGPYGRVPVNTDDKTRRHRQNRMERKKDERAWNQRKALPDESPHEMPQVFL